MTLEEKEMDDLLNDLNLPEPIGQIVELDDGVVTKEILYESFSDWCKRITDDRRTPIQSPD